MSKQEIIASIVKREGGYVNNPADSGGETRWGITQAVARQYGYDGKMYDLPLEVAVEIYDMRYWRPCNLDMIHSFSPALADKMMDIAVNCGVGRLGEWVQRLLNVLNRNGSDWPDMKLDGEIGPLTLKAFNAMIAKRGQDGLRIFSAGLDDLRGAFYIELAERRQKDEAFIYGWLKRKESFHG